MTKRVAFRVCSFREGGVLVKAVYAQGNVKFTCEWLCRRVTCKRRRYSLVTGRGSVGFFNGWFISKV